MREARPGSNRVWRRFGPPHVTRRTFVIDTGRRVLGVVKSELEFDVDADEALAVLCDRASEQAWATCNPRAGLSRSRGVKPGTPRAINPHLLTGAYALGALPDDERAAFEDHLGRCRSCEDEVAGLIETAALLGAAADHVFPIALRPVVLGTARRVQQVPPGSEVTTTSSRQQGFRRAAALVAAACVTAMAVAGVHGALTTPPVTRPVVASTHTRIGDLLAAPDLRLVSAGDPAGTAAISAGRDELLFLADGLRALPQDRVYQLWLVDSRGPRPAGTATAGGEATSLLVHGIRGAAEIVLTVEPAGGSPSPTSAPVVTLALH